MKSRLRDERGFTLTELVVALAVVGVMAGAFTVTRAAIDSAKVSSALEAVETIAAGAVQYAMSRPNGDYGGLSWQSIANQGLVPSGMMYPSWNTPWSGYYDVWADCASASCFTIQLAYYVPNATADRIIQAMSRRASGWRSEYTGGYNHVQLRFDK